MSEDKKYLFIGGQKDGEWLAVSDDRNTIEFPIWDHLYASVSSEEGKDSTFKMDVYHRQEYCTLKGCVTYFLHQDTDMLDAFNALMVAYGERAKEKSNKGRRKDDKKFSHQQEEMVKKMILQKVLTSMIDGLTPDMISGGDPRSLGIAVIEIRQPLTPIDIEQIKIDVTEKIKLESKGEGKAVIVLKFTDRHILNVTARNFGLDPEFETPKVIAGLNVIFEGE